MKSSQLTFIIFLLFVLSSCHEGIIKNGAVYREITPVLKDDVGLIYARESNIDYSYSEVKFATDSNNQWEDTKQAVSIYRRTIDDENYYQCLVIYASGVVAVFVGGKRQNNNIQELNSDAVDTGLTLTQISSGEHTLGCEVKNVSGQDTVRVYLDGTYYPGADYIIGTDSDEDGAGDPGSISVGQVGFGFYDDSGWYKGVHVKSFNSYHEKP
jgi:hypothetical protein